MVNSVNDLWVDLVLRSAVEHFDIKIKSIGSKLTKYLNLDTGELIEVHTDNFNSELRNNVFIDLYQVL
tara:strand:- start:214 stop:417 length:204 start_codon:yes stop_codon:yes gene_type:complete